jgi:hypothetical protein
MVQEPPRRGWIVVIVAIIGAVGVIIAAIIGLGLPFAERLADRYLPPFTPTVNLAQATVIPTNNSTEDQPPSVGPSTQAVNQNNGPFRDHTVLSMGIGVFVQVTSSDGNAPYSQIDLDTNHFQIYRIRLEENR